MDSATRQCRVQFIVAALTCIFAASIPAGAFIDELTVDPASPGCDDEVRVSVQGWFPDTCFLVTGIDTLVQGNTIWFLINAFEYTGPGGCLLMIVEYEAQHSLGTLPEGDYVLAAQELVDPTQTGETDSVPFTVCCTPAPGPVDELTLAKIEGDGQIRFTWNDVAGATEYALYLHDDPDGEFTEGIGSTTSGVTGIDLLPPDGTAGEPQFFLVTAKNGCAESPKR